MTAQRVAELLPCPKCGRAPRVRESKGLCAPDVWFYTHIECRKWFGLAECFGVHGRSYRLTRDELMDETALQWNRVAERAWDNREKDAAP